MPNLIFQQIDEGDPFDLLQAFGIRDSMECPVSINMERRTIIRSLGRC